MTLNDLIKEARSISVQLTSGDIPLTMNDKPIEVGMELKKDSNNHYYTELRIKET